MTKFVKMTALLIALGASGAALPAYAGDGGEFFGTGLGAALGGLAGSQFGKGSGNVAATVTGVVLGGLIGNSIGESYDNDQRHRSYYRHSRDYGYSAPVYYSGAYEPTYVAPYAPAPHQVVYYSAPPVTYREESPVYVTSGYVGGYQPPQQQQYCREYTQRVVVGGQTQESYGTACLQPDGSWKVQQ